MDTETDERLKISNQENLTLTVLHLESYYNYRTVGINFQLVSSILSHHDAVKNIEIIKSGTKQNTYTVADEIKCACLNTHSKKQRIVAAFKQLRNENKDKIINEEFLNLDLSPSEIDNTPVRIKPMFCREELDRTKKKNPCAECETLCAYSIEDLLDSNHGIGQADLKIELEKHHHPKTRKIENRQQTTHDAAKELANHYIFSHNQKAFEVL